MQKTLLTVEQAAAMCGPDERWELIEGELVKEGESVQMVPAGHYHGAIANIIAHFLTAHVLERRLGIVATADAGYILRRHPDSLRAPDVSFVARQRLEHGRPAVGFAEMAPDLVVEVVSPSDSADAVQKKARMWLEAGVRLVLVVYPETQVVAAHRNLREATHYGRGESIDFAPVFPGFSVPVDDIFNAVDLGGP